jgi:DNA mismatch repair ATPase MutS
MQELYGRKMKVLASLSPLIRTFEERAVQAPLLKAVKQLLVNGKAASKEVGRLVKLLDALDQRGNVLLTFLLNGLFFWELRQAIKIEHWKEKTAPHLPQWLEAVKKIDALCSLSTFAYNHPEYAYPTIDSAPFPLTIKAAGHPLMDAKKCVRNDFGMSQSPYFIIVTGANMAGKSTYLRTIGVNYLLACIGCPVCGKEMSLHPNQLITSLRTSDSLSENESYFFAELKRLQLIIRKLHNGEKLFIILDEILKGTNSVDKQKGSLALIEQLIRLQTNGVIATHDLLLGTLKETFPANIRNYCFEADIVDNELHFSYRLREGIAQNMNACFLMNKMGITVPS